MELAYDEEIPNMFDLGVYHNPISDGMEVGNSHALSDAFGDLNWSGVGERDSMGQQATTSESQSSSASEIISNAEKEHIAVCLNCPACNGIADIQR
jgi:hypothetical protein